MYLSVFYCLFHVNNISTDMLEKQVSYKRDPDLNEEDDIRMEEIREDHWRDVSEYYDYKRKIHALW